MYALVNGNQLILGPINFNVGMFNYELEELEVDYVVKASDSLQVPLAITNQVKILPTINNIPSYDSRFEEIFQDSHEILEDQVVFHYIKKEKSLQQVKEERKSVLPGERRKLENTFIDIPLNGTNIRISTSRESRISYVSKLLSSSNSGTYNFKFDNNVWLEITTADLNYIIQTIDQTVQAAFDWEAAKAQLIDACTTPQEVYDIEVVIPSLG